MSHTHAGNAGDYVKHTVLAVLLDRVKSDEFFSVIRYIDPFAGEGLFSEPAARYCPSERAPFVEYYRRCQPALPMWYFGSPLVAFWMLKDCRGREIEFFLADSDPAATATLCTALSSDSPCEEIRHSFQTNPCRVALNITAHPYDPTSLPLAVGSDALNIILLDPTHPRRYKLLLSQTITRCNATNANVIILAWGLRDWNLFNVIHRRKWSCWPFRYEVPDDGPYQLCITHNGPQTKIFGRFLGNFRARWWPGYDAGAEHAAREREERGSECHEYLLDREGRVVTYAQLLMNLLDETEAIRCEPLADEQSVTAKREQLWFSCKNPDQVFA